MYTSFIRLFRYHPTDASVCSFVTVTVVSASFEFACALTLFDEPDFSFVQAEIEAIKDEAVNSANTAADLIGLANDTLDEAKTNLVAIP